MNISALKFSKETRSKLSNPVLSKEKKKELRKQRVIDFIRNRNEHNELISPKELIIAAGFNPDSKSDYSKGWELLRQMQAKGIIGTNTQGRTMREYYVSEDVKKQLDAEAEAEAQKEAEMEAHAIAALAAQEIEEEREQAIAEEQAEDEAIKEENRTASLADEPSGDDEDGDEPAGEGEEMPDVLKTILMATMVDAIIRKHQQEHQEVHQAQQEREAVLDVDLLTTKAKEYAWTHDSDSLREFIQWYTIIGQHQSEQVAQDGNA